MTFVLSVNGPRSLWMVVDRRLSYGKSRPPRDDARKVMLLDTTDGRAIIGYAGLGATARGSEPADWLAAVLRGRNLSMGESVSVLAAAAQQELPRHLAQIPTKGRVIHTFVISALVDGAPRLYMIDLVLSADRRSSRFRSTQHVVPSGLDKGLHLTHRFTLGGSGSATFLARLDWHPHLLTLIRAYDRGQISSRPVSDHLAALNLRAHAETGDGTVSRECIVVWRNPAGAKDREGGGHQFYTGLDRDGSTSALPSIVNGMDLTAIIGVLMPNAQKRLRSLLHGGQGQVPELDVVEMNRLLRRLPEGPDERLR